MLFTFISNSHIIAIDGNGEVIIGSCNSSISIGGKHHVDHLSKNCVDDVVFGVVYLSWVDEDNVVFGTTCDKHSQRHDHQKIQKLFHFGIR